MARQRSERLLQRFDADRGRGDRRSRYRSILKGLAFLTGAVLCLLVLTPLSRIFGGPLDPDETAAIIIGVLVCSFLWLNKHKFSKCPICHKGTLRPINLGSVEDKLGVTDHPMFRENTWTQWYECRFCGYREWDEEENPSR